MQTTSIQNLSYEQLEQLIQRLLDEKLAVLTNSYPLGAGGAAWFESLRADILPTEAGQPSVTDLIHQERAAWYDTSSSTPAP